MTLTNKLLISVVIIFVLLIFMGGYKVGKESVYCPSITTDTITTFDTVVHEIKTSYPYYVNHTDTVYKTDTILTEVDTIAILVDYFNIHSYSRTWEDDTLKVMIKDEITMNRSISNTFKYVIKVPFKTVINNVDNSVTYNRYFSLGLSIPIRDARYMELEGLYNWDKGYIGAGYSYELKSASVKVGAVIFKLKKKI